MKKTQTFTFLYRANAFFLLHLVSICLIQGADIKLATINFLLTRLLFLRCILNKSMVICPNV